MKYWLRVVYYMFRRFREMLSGPENVQLKRLMKAGRVEIGRHTYGYPIIKTFDMIHTKLIVGNYSALSETSIIMLGGEHAMDRVTTYPHRMRFSLPGAGEDGIPVPTPDTRIGSDVWLTQRTFLRSGVTIGDGAVIAAGAVVNKDVPPFAIVGGVPARVLGYRHTEEQREALLEIRWWDWSDEEVLAAVPLLQDSDIDAFIDYARKRFPDGDYPFVENDEKTLRSWRRA